MTYMLREKPKKEWLEQMARAIHNAWSSHFGDGKSFDEIDKMSQAARFAEARAAYEALRQSLIMQPMAHPNFGRRRDND